MHIDETGARCHWHIKAPITWKHWGDVRAFDGTVSLIQPLIAPLYNGKSEYEFVIALVAFVGRCRATTSFAGYWQGQIKGDFDTAWRKALNDGFLANTALPAKSVAAKGGNIPATTASSSRSDGSDVPPRSDDLRRQPREQRRGCRKRRSRSRNLCWDNAVLNQSQSGEEVGLGYGRHRRDRGQWPQGEWSDLAAARTS